VLEETHTAADAIAGSAHPHSWCNPRPDRFVILDRSKSVLRAQQQRCDPDLSHPFAREPAEDDAVRGRQWGQRATGCATSFKCAAILAIAAGQHAQRQAASGVPAKASAGINAHVNTTRRHRYARRALIERIRGRPNMRITSIGGKNRPTLEFYFSTERETKEFLYRASADHRSRAK
jgi:hypothetical protein